MGISQKASKFKHDASYPNNRDFQNIFVRYFFAIYCCFHIIDTILRDEQVDMRVYESPWYAWLYIRYYGKCELGDLEKDDDFSFVSFFPSFIRELIEPSVNQLYTLSIKLGAFKLYGFVSKESKQAILTNSDIQKYFLLRLD